MRYVTRDAMKALDRHTIEERGVPAATLMDQAGKAVAREALALVPKGRAYVFAGYGNNGGDGLVAARHLKKKGLEVTVFLVGRPKAFSPESNGHLERLFSTGVYTRPVTTALELKSIEEEPSPDVIIDAVFGIGMKGAPDEFFQELFRMMNRRGCPIVSCDIPSGLDADTGEASGEAVRATVTVTFAFPKVGFRNDNAQQYIGRMVVADIGIIDEGSSPRAIREKRHTVVVRDGRKGVLRQGHPWIFKGQLRALDMKISPGKIVDVRHPDGSLVGRGYYNPQSEIAVRLMTFKDESVDDALIGGRVAEAFRKRAALLEMTDAVRVVHSEADRLPGFVADIYKDVVVFQALTLGADRLKESFVRALREVIHPVHIYEKSVSPFRALEGIADVAAWHGEPGESVVTIHEGGLSYKVDIVSGHKTGFYLDQRKSRHGLENISKGRRVLDLFCYTGAFSIAAAHYGASSVLGVDIKDAWTKLAADNAALNNVALQVSFKVQDVFKALREIQASGERYDIIVLDPPSFLKKRESLASAVKGYRELNVLAMKTLSEGGILCTFSCSHNMPNETFSQMLKASARDAKKRIDIVKRCHQSEDHPIVRCIPETEYLKGYFLKVSAL